MITLARRDRDRRGDRGFHCDRDYERERRDHEYERERRDRDRCDRSRRGGYSQGSINTAAIAGAVIGAIIAKNT